LIDPGDKVAVMLPNYLQTWGLAQNFGAQVLGFPLRPERQWEPTPEEIRTAIAPGTKLVVVTHPHNPPGPLLSGELRRPIPECAISRSSARGASSRRTTPCSRPGSSASGTPSPGIRPRPAPSAW